MFGALFSFLALFGGIVSGISEYTRKSREGSRREYQLRRREREYIDQIQEDATRRINQLSTYALADSSSIVYTKQRAARAVNLVKIDTQEEIDQTVDTGSFSMFFHDIVSPIITLGVSSYLSNALKANMLGSKVDPKKNPFFNSLNVKLTEGALFGYKNARSFYNPSFGLVPNTKSITESIADADSQSYSKMANKGVKNVYFDSSNFGSDITLFSYNLKSNRRRRGWEFLDDELI